MFQNVGLKMMLAAETDKVVSEYRTLLEIGVSYSTN